MELKLLNDATTYINSIKRISKEEEAIKPVEEYLLLPDTMEISVLEDSNVVIRGTGNVKDYKAKDLLRVIKIIDAINVEYEETNILVPSIYAHSLEKKPWHITTQGFLTTRFTKELGAYILEETERLGDYYGKHPMDSLWLPCSKRVEEIEEGEVICIFNRRISGWDGSIDRPVIELLGAGGHLQSIWNESLHRFVTRDLVNNLEKEFDEEIGIKLTENEVQSIGGFVNQKTYELVILSNIYIAPQLIPQIQKYAIGNFEEDTDGIYLGSFEETMDFYKKDATYFAGGKATAKTNFPNNEEIMKRFCKILDI